MMPKGMLVVTPSRVTVGESFAICVKLRGDVHHVPCENAFCTVKPRQRGPFNLNVQRGIQYLDDTLAEWEGTLEVHGDGLSGPRQIVFDGLRQGVFEGDRRPIGRFGPFHFDRPGMHFVRLVDPRSGLVGLANAVHVTAKPPAERLWWGDPHWQTFFSDGIRCPEELYAFARDEAFLDFGAISDHMEAITDRQWDYFQAVTNDFNAPGRFATLIGQEWTHHLAEGGAPGHRNLYVRDDRAPAWRCTDSECNSLERLWRCLDELGPARVIAIAHHTANPVMGVDWEQAWNERYEKAVEIYSVWGSSEKLATAGNSRPIRACNGERAGRHVVDALRRGRRLGFVGGGDIHDGRPGDDLHTAQAGVAGYATDLYPQGLTAAWTPRLTRENIFDAIASRRTYATTRRRIYLKVDDEGEGRARRLNILAAAEDGVSEVCLVRQGEDADGRQPEVDPRVVRAGIPLGQLAPDEFCYIRVMTATGDIAWSSPIWGDRR